MQEEKEAIASASPDPCFSKQLREARILAIMERSNRFPIRGLKPLTYEQASQVVDNIDALNGKVLDGIGLGLSVGAPVSPPGIALRLGVVALGIDIIQGDIGGIISGGVAMKFPNYGTAAIDVGYSIYQVFK